MFLPFPAVQTLSLQPATHSITKMVSLELMARLRIDTCALRCDMGPTRGVDCRRPTECRGVVCVAVWLSVTPVLVPIITFQRTTLAIVHAIIATELTSTLHVRCVSCRSCQAFEISVGSGTALVLSLRPG